MDNPIKPRIQSDLIHLAAFAQQSFDSTSKDGLSHEISNQIKSLEKISNNPPLFPNHLISPIVKLLESVIGVMIHHQLDVDEEDSDVHQSEVDSALEDSDSGFKNKKKKRKYVRAPVERRQPVVKEKELSNSQKMLQIHLNPLLEGKLPKSNMESQAVSWKDLVNGVYDPKYANQRFTTTRYQIIKSVLWATSKDSESMLGQSTYRRHTNVEKGWHVVQQACQGLDQVEDLLCYIYDSWSWNTHKLASITLAQQVAGVIEEWKKLVEAGETQLTTPLDTVSNVASLPDFHPQALIAHMDRIKKGELPKLPPQPKDANQFSFQDLFSGNYKPEWENSSSKSGRGILAKCLWKEKNLRESNAPKSSTYKQYKRIVKGWESIRGKLRRLEEGKDLASYIYDGFNWNTGRLSDLKLVKIVSDALIEYHNVKYGPVVEAEEGGELEESGEEEEEEEVGEEVVESDYKE